MPREISLDYGAHGEPSTRCVQTEYVVYTYLFLCHKAKTLCQGYELSEEEIGISLDEFRERFADASGSPEYALPTTPTSTLYS